MKIKSCKNINSKEHEYIESKQNQFTSFKVEIDEKMSSMSKNHQKKRNAISNKLNNYSK